MTGKGCTQQNNPPVSAYAETSPFTQGGLFSLSLPCIRGGGAAKPRRRGCTQQNNPPVSAYAETSPFTQGGLFSLSLPCVRGGGAAKPRRRGCEEKQSLSRLRRQLPLHKGAFFFKLLCKSKRPNFPKAKIYQILPDLLLPLLCDCCIISTIRLFV